MAGTQTNLAPSGVATPEALRAAKVAGLRWVSDALPGIRRAGTERRWRYLDPDGRSIGDPEVLARIRALAVPPAWSDVWICPRADGHVQATGRDAKGRKQYRYHPRWRAVRDDTKFDRMVAFAAALPALRRRVDAALARPGLSHERVVAAVVRLLETSLIRVGNDEYAAHNGSYGLTTMLDRHLEVSGSRIRFEFRGKSGVKHGREVRDARLARIVSRCQELPGETLFQYVGDDGERCPIGSSDVNEWLREVTGEPYTSKDFRTWAGSLLAFVALRGAERPRSVAARRRAVNEAIDRVAARLGNTRAVCRRSYVHPGVLEAFEAGELPAPSRGADEDRVDEATIPELARDEAALVRFLRARSADRPEIDELLRRSRRGRARPRSGSRATRSSGP